MADTHKTITQVSQEFGVTPNTIRYYEQEGIIPPIPKGPNGNRYFGERECYWLEQAICLRHSGLPVQELAHYVTLCQEGPATRAERLQLLEAQRATLLAQQAQLARSIQRLEDKIHLYQAGTPEGAARLAYYEATTDLLNQTGEES